MLNIILPQLYEALSNIFFYDSMQDAKSVMSGKYKGKKYIDIGRRYFSEQNEL